MNRVLVALLFGAAAGGAVTYYSTAERRVTPDAPPSKPVAASPAVAARSEPVGASAIRRAARPGADRDSSRRSDESPAALVVLSEREPVEALE